jgi:flagellar basal body-associated protein FliL
MPKIVIIIAIVVILAGGGYFLLNQRNKAGISGAATPEQAASTQPSTTTSDTRAQTQKSGTGSLMDIMQFGGNQKCIWSAEQAGHPINGTVYISGNKVRSEARSHIDPIGELIAYVVAVDNTVTFWTSLAPDQKTVMTKAEMEAAGDSTEAQNKQAYEQFKAQYNYKCETWTPDPAKFVIN